MSDEYNNSEKDNQNHENTNSNTDAEHTDSTYSWVNPKINSNAKESGTANDDMAKYASDHVNSRTSGQQSDSKQDKQREYYHINEEKQTEHNEKDSKKW